MTTNFPSSKDDFSTGRPTSGQPLSNPNHITRHTNVEDAVEALETKVGADSSAVTTSLDYLIKNSSSVNPGHKHTLAGAMTDVSITTPSEGDGFTYDATTKKWKNTQTTTADASATVAGVTKLSVAAETASDPIAVGDNDTRVPTQDENDALAGTSGTPSSTNKFVTDDDTTGTGSVLRYSVITSFVFGDGSDGDVTISTDTNLSRDMYYKSLTIDSGVTLNCKSYRIFVKGTFTNNGTLKNDTGGAASGKTGGTAVSAGTIGAPAAGSDGGNGGIYTSSTQATSGSAVNVNPGIGNAAADGKSGGTGGTGDPPDGSPGAGASAASGGTVTDPIYNSVSILQNALLFMEMEPGSSPKRILGMGGAASGGGGGFGQGGLDGGVGASGGIGGDGGGSGANGGTIWVSAQIFAGTGTVTSLGGSGGNGSAGNAGSVNSTIHGGGGGGGAGGNGGCGGLFFLITTSRTFTGTVTLTGGAGGTGGNGGASGGGTATAGSKGTDGATGTTGVEIDFLIS